VRRKTIIARSAIGETGAGSLLALAFVAVALSVLGWLTVVGQIGSKQLEAQALADRIALAADDALRGKTAAAPCELANQISAENSAVLDTCRIVESKVFIELHIYIDFSFSQKAVTLGVRASAAAEPARQESNKSF
jgi:secretion/DNA translocation related TadE-like protein